MHGTKKSDIIEDDYNPPELVACSIYDTKRVHLSLSLIRSNGFQKKKKKDKAKNAFLKLII